MSKPEMFDPAVLEETQMLEDEGAFEADAECFDLADEDPTDEDEE